MFFGGCYLGRHLHRIGEIQRHTVEEEILAEEVERCLKAAGDNSLPLEEESRSEVLAGLVQEFHPDSSFQTNENGELFIVLDQNTVVEAARRITGES